jgi:multicomponent Na+:H+ antiporter subunit B
VEAIVDYTLLALLAVTALAILRLRSLFAVVMLMGIYSLLSAGLFVVLDAHDVAFTEAAVGAGISTILALGTLTLVGSARRDTPTIQLLPLLVVVVTGAALIYGSMGLPPWGAADNPIHQHVAPRYLIDSVEEVDVPNIVAAVLASYRSFDTMGETTVVFAAVVGVFALLVAGGSGADGPRAGGKGPSGPASSGTAGVRRRKEKR